MANALNPTKNGELITSEGSAEHFPDSQTVWNAHSPGPRYEGQYLRNMIKSWRIDGDEFYNCYCEAGAGDSTCFGCLDLQVNSDG
ncbi:hypothetical protein CDEST_02257 [Colletotrichum destructivum]|uniref:Uncharacterized protein n=1 Tax=Colletotrichum destructivum TaxID=34406 RepID=A0AAX4I2P4_9PEZI|nr:hypothetical protein CDEST_02257 [Colletotrichum destructivum]